MEGFSADSNLSNKSIRPIAIVSQLLQQVATMHHIDELFMWVTGILVQNFDVVSAQIWANQASSRGEVHRKVRVNISQHTSQALQLFEGAEMRNVIEHILHEQRGILCIPVTNVFSHYQASVLAQQNCRYWTLYFSSKDVFLPPPQRHAENDEVSTPLQMVFSLFTQRPLQSSQARAIRFLIEQSLRIAISHELLSKTAEKPQEAIQLKVAYLIPEHMQIADVEQGDNPFSTTIVISERGIRQIYNSIDGKKSIKDIALLLDMNPKEVLEAMQSLLQKGYINVREVGGNIVAVSSFSQIP